MPGVPRLGRLTLGDQDVGWLLAPQAPGGNLVQVGVAATIRAGTAPPVAARPRAGTTGYWALVQLPPGRSRLSFGLGDERRTVAVDTGRGGGNAVGMRGADAAECVQAALGELLAGRSDPLTGCPDGRLTTADAKALRAVVGFLAGRRVKTFAVTADASPRSVAAARVVRDAARRAGLAESASSTGDTPVVVVSGWTVADRFLRQVGDGRQRAQGTYLAPWLMTAPLLSYSAGQIVPSRYDVKDPGPQRYATALGTAFPGATPSYAGYSAWLKPSDDNAAIRLYAASVIVIPGTGLRPVGSSPEHHHDGGATWLPDGLIVPISPEIHDN